MLNVHKSASPGKFRLRILRTCSSGMAASPENPQLKTKIGQLVQHDLCFQLGVLRTGGYIQTPSNYCERSTDEMRSFICTVTAGNNIPHAFEREPAPPFAKCAPPGATSLATA